MPDLVRLSLIAGIGGFAGTIVRFLTSRYIQAASSSGFPFGTFAVNITGCLLIGILYGLSEKGEILNAEWRLFLAVGFCGGLTTFSAFAQENFSLVREGDFFLFALYTSLSVFLGLIAVFFGNLIIQKIF